MTQKWFIAVANNDSPAQRRRCASHFIDSYFLEEDETMLHRLLAVLALVGSISLAVGCSGAKETGEAKTDTQVKQENNDYMQKMMQAQQQQETQKSGGTGQ
jgi:hypothetical protein